MQKAGLTLCDWQKSLYHPNVTKLFEVIATKKNLYLFMGHVNGGDLLDYLENHDPRSEGEARAMFFS